MIIVSRAEWGAVAPRARVAMHLPSPELWLHHTAAEQHGPAGVRDTQRFHMHSRGWADIAYSFLVDDDGTVYEGRGDGVVGGHTEGHNSRSHAVCLMGNYDEHDVTTEQAHAVGELLAHGHDHGWWGDHFTGGHRQASGAQTACPGRYGMALLRRIHPSTPSEALVMGKYVVAKLFPDATPQANGRWAFAALTADGSLEVHNANVGWLAGEDRDDPGESDAPMVGFEWLVNELGQATGYVLMSEDGGTFKAGEGRLLARLRD